MRNRIHVCACLLGVAFLATLGTSTTHAQRGGRGGGGGGAGMCQGAGGGSIGTGVPTSFMPGYTLPYSYMPQYQMPYSLPYMYTPPPMNYGSGNAASFADAAPAIKEPKVTRQSVLAQFDKNGNGKLEGDELKAARTAASQRRKQK